MTVNTRSLAKIGLAALASLTLTGCQLVYEVSVAAQDGHLIFKTVWKRFGGDKPAAVEQLWVVEESQHPRIVWKVESIATNGQDMEQLQYGQTPRGFRLDVASEPLKIGQLYNVELWGLGGMDEAYFVVARHEIGRRVTVVH